MAGAGGATVGRWTGGGGADSAIRGGGAQLASAPKRNSKEAETDRIGNRPMARRPAAQAMALARRRRFIA
jgi:hypothetical protein